MIWGLKLQPGEFHSETIKTEIQLSLAALESRNLDDTPDSVVYNQVIVQTDTEEYILCTLVHGVQFQQYLGMKLMPGEKVKFCVQGKYSVHLTGYSTCSPEGHVTVGAQQGNEPVEQTVPSEQGSYDGWQTNNVSDVKEEPPDQDMLEDNMQAFPDFEQVFSKPSVRVSPVKTQQQLEQPQRLSPQMQQKTHPRTLIQHKRPLPQQRLQSRMQSQMRSVRKRSQIGQRAQFMGTRTPGAMRQRGPIHQQRRNLQTNFRREPHMRQEPRIRVQPAATNVPKSHSSPSHRVLQHQMQQANVLPESVNIPTDDRLQESFDSEPYPIAVEVSDLPGSSMGYIPPTSATDLGGGITLSDMPGTSVPNIQRTAVPNVQGTSMLSYSQTSMSDMTRTSVSNIPGNLNIGPGTSVADIPGTSGMSDFPGTSQEGSEQTDQHGDFCFYPEGDLKYEQGMNMESQMAAESLQAFGEQSPSKTPGRKSSRSPSARNISTTCEICQKEFFSTQTLKRHLRIHSGSKPFSCSHCGKSFTQKYACVYHERQHFGISQFKCMHCKKLFVKAENLMDHIKNYHQGDPQNLYQCQFCGKSFPTSSGCKKHEHSHS